LARALIAKGHRIGGVDGMTTYYDVSLKEARLRVLEETGAFTAYRHMLEDMAALEKTAEKIRPELIVHLAAQAGVRYSLENPRAYIDSNLVGTFNLLEIARRTNPAHFLMASTSSIYGANTNMPFREIDRTDHPMTLYAASKKGTEDIAHSYAHLWRIPVTALRFFTVYGPWGRPDMAYFKFVKGGLAGQPVDIYNHGRMKRDFTYIDDVVESVVRLVDCVPEVGKPVCDFDSLSPAAPYRAVNVGGGHVVELSYFIEEVERNLGFALKKNMLEMQKGDVPATLASPDLLKRLTGFTPETSVATGVRKFVEWYRSYYGSK
jgi:UDP-glucuronate 4-epimerase